MRFRFRTVAAVAALLVVSAWIAPATSMASSSAAKPQVTIKESPSGRMITRMWPPSKPGVAVPSREQIRKMVAADPLDCGENGTCIECDVFAWAPQAADTIITYEGATYCYYPLLDYAPAIVTQIDMQLGLVLGCCHLVKVAPYTRMETDHLDITDASPCTAPDWYATLISVTVFFPQCCPYNDTTGGVTVQFYVGCRAPGLAQSG